MKVLVNGGLNLSEVDGWWAEAYAPEVGWALGDGQEHGDDAAWDVAEAEALYGLLEREVVPTFYTRDEQGIPAAWIAKMRASMARLTPRFSTNRVVREYTETYYVPLAARYRERAADKGALGTQLAAWRRALGEHWHVVRFGAVRTEAHDGSHRFTVAVDFGDLEPGMVRAELYAEPLGGGETERHRLACVRKLEGPGNSYEFEGSAPASRAVADYTLRLVPFHPAATIPLEAHQILWQR
jgi:starch phosphorylase